MVDMVIPDPSRIGPSRESLRRSPVASQETCLYMQLYHSVVAYASGKRSGKLSG